MPEEKINALLRQLKDKYSLEGQEMEGYLEGLIYQQYLDYWDYIQTDALLSLQVQRTNVPDEMIFIIYHQITELYFKLVLWEINQLTGERLPTAEEMTERLRRMNSYFRNLTHSFEIMVNGMEKEQFLKFRLSLLPASGFQSLQYRMIEVASTDLGNLVTAKEREAMKGGTIEEQYEKIYWKFGATEVETGKKTLTLRRFESHFADFLISWAHKHKAKNLWRIYLAVKDSGEKTERLDAEMKEFDQYVNVRWPLMHIKSAGRYLSSDDKDIPATGGTNWANYLPPKAQRRIFFPALWLEDDIANWGRSSQR